MIRVILISICRLFSHLMALSTAVVLLSSCSSLPQKNTVTVQLPPDARMHFSGKGAGAGMMLMSSMGPMGIAIGVAIDEGIGKDIGKAAADLDIANLAAEAFQPLAEKQQRNLQITIDEYGFITAPIPGNMVDPVIPKLVVTITGLTELPEQRVLDQAAAANCPLPGWALADIKTNQALIGEAFTRGFACLATAELQEPQELKELQK